MNEIWLPIINYDNYEVSNLGNVRSIKSAKNLKPNITHGYYQVSLYVNGNKKQVYIHRLVAKAFIDNPESKPTINHKDGIKINNNVFNLEWATFSENTQHAFKTGLMNLYWKGKFGVEHSASKPVIQLDKAGNTLNRFVSAREAEMKTNICYQSISQCCLNKRMSAGKYVWKYDIEL